jgi:PAS domain-containing protein
MGFETLTMRIADRLREHGPVARYGLAVVAVTVATILTASALPLLSRSIFVFYVAAVVATAWAGGLGPALLATALSVLAADYLFLVPTGSYWPASIRDLFPLAMFAAVSVLVSSLSGALTAARRRAEAQATTLREQGERLEEQAEALERQVGETQATAEALERANEDLQATMIVADATRAAAERAERRVSAILSSISDAFVAYDRSWRFVYANERARSLFREFGRVDDPIGRVLWDTFPSSSAPSRSASCVGPWSSRCRSSSSPSPPSSERGTRRGSTRGRTGSPSCGGT